MMPPICFKPGHYNTDEGCLICQGKGFPRERLIDEELLDRLDEEHERLVQPREFDKEMRRLARLGLEAEERARSGIIPDDDLIARIARRNALAEWAEEHERAFKLIVDRLGEADKTVPFLGQRELWTLMSLRNALAALPKEGEYPIRESVKKWRRGVRNEIGWQVLDAMPKEEPVLVLHRDLVDQARAAENNAIPTQKIKLGDSMPKPFRKDIRVTSKIWCGQCRKWNETPCFGHLKEEPATSQRTGECNKCRRAWTGEGFENAPQHFGVMCFCGGSVLWDPA